MLSTKLTNTSQALAVLAKAFNTSPFCITIFEPESISSSEPPTGIGASLITLKVVPPEVITTVIFIDDVCLFTHLIEINASSEFEVTNVVGDPDEFEIELAKLFSKS